MLFSMVIASMFLTFSNATSDPNFLENESEELQPNLTVIERNLVGLEYRVANDSNSEWIYNSDSFIKLFAILEPSRYYEMRLINKNTRVPFPNSTFILSTFDDDFPVEEAPKSNIRTILHWILVGAFMFVIFCLISFLFKNIFID